MPEGDAGRGRETVMGCTGALELQPAMERRSSGYEAPLPAP